MFVQKKLVIVGDGAVGKTSLLTVFVKNEFPRGYIPTIFENYVIDITLQDGKKIQLCLWDTSGQETYDRLRPIQYPHADVVVICFSLIARDSLSNVLLKWSPEVRKYCPDVPVILVGTKVDLRDDLKIVEQLNLSRKRGVPTSKALDVSQRIRAWAYVETSALTRYNVKFMFETAARAAMRFGRRKRSPKCVLL